MLEHGSIVHRFTDSFAPGEWAMTGYQDGGTGERVSPIKGVDYHLPRVRFVILFDFTRSHLPGAWNGAMKIVGMRGTESGNPAASLSPGRGEQTVGMNNSANSFECTVENQMGCGVGTGLKLALHQASAIESHYDHVSGLHPLIWHA